MSDKDAILIAFNNESKISYLAIEKIVGAICSFGLKTIIRWGGRGNIFGEYYSNNPLVIIDESKVLKETMEFYSRSLAVITDASSLAYTFSLTTLQPTILFFENPKALDYNLNGITFEDLRFHLVAYDIPKLKEHLKYLVSLRDKNENPYKEVLENYRLNEVYNFGHSSEWIAKFITQTINKQD